MLPAFLRAKTPWVSAASALCGHQRLPFASFSAAAHTAAHGATTAAGASDDPVRDEAALKERLVDAALPHVKQLGWSHAALVAAARDLGLSPAVTGILPGAESGLVESVIRRYNRQLAAELCAAKLQLERQQQYDQQASQQQQQHGQQQQQREEPLGAGQQAQHGQQQQPQEGQRGQHQQGQHCQQQQGQEQETGGSRAADPRGAAAGGEAAGAAPEALVAGLSSPAMPQRLGAALRRRLELGVAPHIDTWPQALAVMSRPANGPRALALLAELSDEVLAAAGDGSVDMDWYAKRALVGGVYAATELYMLADFSPKFQDTWHQLDRRLRDVEALGDAANAAGSAAQALLGELARSLGGARRSSGGGGSDGSSGGGVGSGVWAGGAGYSGGKQQQGAGAHGPAGTWPGAGGIPGGAR